MGNGQFATLEKLIKLNNQIYIEIRNKKWTKYTRIFKNKMTKNNVFVVGSKSDDNAGL